MKVMVPLPFDVSDLAQGRNLRVVHLMRELNGRCELECVTPDEGIADAARSVLPGVRIVVAGHCRADVRPGASYVARRALAFFGYYRSLVAEMHRRAASADVVLGFDVPSVAYLLAASGGVDDGEGTARVQGSRPRIVCDLIDDPRLTWRSLPLRWRCGRAGIKTALAVRVLRSRVLRAFDALTAVAPRDATELSQASGVIAAVVPNGVEVPADAPGPRERESMAVFTGTMHFPPNEAAARYLVRRIWPRVRQLLRAHAEALGTDRLEAGPTRLEAGATLPEAGPTLAIVGADPTPRVRALADAPGVLVTGRVEDVSAWLGWARVAVAPMISGCGMKNKVLEACAAGCPVVATPLGAAGLPAGANKGVIVAEKPADIAREVARLLADPAASLVTGAAGRAFVREHCSWSRSAAALMQVLAGEKRPARSEADAYEPAPRHEARPDRASDVAPAGHEEALAHAHS